MQDRVHQPYRAPLLPGMMEIIDAAVAAGSPGSALSGAGSGVFAFAYSHNEATVGAAMETAAKKHGMDAYCLYLAISSHGLEVIDVC
jgi:homoserine kinase